MTLHLVTAAQAEDHISSSDDARLYEAFVGSGGIVFSQGNKMSASMTDPNTMRIMDGVALLCGRYWNITNYEEVTITNGTPGMNSIALVVANIKTDPSEAVTLKVYEGVETEGEPVMPSYIEGDLNGGDTESEMPLYAVTKTGLSVGDPMPQFEVFLSEKKFRDSISHYSTTETPTGKTWIDGKPIYRKVIKFGAMAGNNRYTIAHGVSYDTIVSFNAIARNSTNSYLPLARVGYNRDSQIDASLNGYAYITPDDAIIIGGSQTNYTGAHVVIEYTKA